jgi:hypothetical protein
MFSPVSSSALAITNVGYGADELNDSCADEKCLNAIAELGGGEQTRRSFAGLDVNMKPILAAAPVRGWSAIASRARSSRESVWSIMTCGAKRPET